jgi:hypothetical protein
VQKLRGTPRRIDRLGEANPLTGLLFCADCGAKLYNHRRARPALQKKNGKIYQERPPDTYQCSVWKLNTSKFADTCSAHHIKTETVRGIIFDVLRKTCGYVNGHEEEFAELVRASSAVRQGETAKSYRNQIVKNERRIAELSKIYRSLYEDKALGKLPEGRFDEMTAGYGQEQIDLTAQTAALQAELDAFNADSVRVDKFIELARRYTRLLC